MTSIVDEPVLNCRACGSQVLRPILDLGYQALSGRFPASGEPDPSTGCVGLVICEAGDKNKGCGLVQLSRSFAPSEMYGETYGYASAITATMRSHLADIAGYVSGWARLRPGDAILDIGSNDGTLLSNFKNQDLLLTGIDPSAEQYRDRYVSEAALEVDFFSTEAVKRVRPGVQFKAITSVAMLYDIEALSDFMTDVQSLLANDGVWFTEQSHAGAMFDQLCYDSICHEHVTYLTLKILMDLGKKVGLKAIDTRRNSVNGGSFSVLFAQDDSDYRPNSVALNRLLDLENQMGLENTNTWAQFCERVISHRERFRNYILKANADGRMVLGYGASTKGNVLLQYCSITPDLMPAIAERDPRKFGCRTPGTNIPIVSEAKGRAMGPDIFVVFPWHFRDEIIRRERSFLDGGGTLLFPLPEFTLVTG
ncbi:MAG: class I SAM-dependent methyltransferase [Rhodospirillaceae bacterium]